MSKIDFKQVFYQIGGIIRTMSRRKENSQFLCEQCGRHVLPLSNGSYRNHCPFCLFSKHVDILPGDRASDCGGLMEPVGLTSIKLQDMMEEKFDVLRRSLGEKGYIPMLRYEKGEHIIYVIKKTKKKEAVIRMEQISAPS